MRWFMVWVAAVCCTGADRLYAQAAEPDWVAQVFPERTHQFGNVARGSVVRYAFPIVNRTEFEVRIVNWETKCGCTNVRVGSKVIPPGTQTTIEATIDTTQFQGPKASGLKLFLDRPTVAVVDLNVNCFIRTDITMAPGLIDFGVVRPSETAGNGRSHRELLRRPARLGNRRHENPDGQGQGRRQGTGPIGRRAHSMEHHRDPGNTASRTAISRMRSS